MHEMSKSIQKKSKQIFKNLANRSGSNCILLLSFFNCTNQPLWLNCLKQYPSKIEVSKSKPCEARRKLRDACSPKKHALTNHAISYKEEAQQRYDILRQLSVRNGSKTTGRENSKQTFGTLGSALGTVSRFLDKKW